MFTASTRRLGCALLTSALALAPSTAQRTTGAASPTAEIADTDVLIAAFARKSKREQTRVLEAMRQAVRAIDDPWLVAIRELAADGANAGKPRVAESKASRRFEDSETAVEHAVHLRDQLPFPVHHEYRFGLGTIDAVEASDGHKRQSKSKREHAMRIAQLRAMLEGLPPNLDLAYAQLLRELDDQRSVDLHAAFLDSWRNGSETFYEALERSYRTGEGVFFHDAMLSDWVRTCVPKDHPDRRRLVRGPKQASTPFQHASRTYATYRSFREALALAMVLGPDAALPPSLARYENDGGSMHSMREIAELVLAAHQSDPRRVARGYVAGAPELPRPLWSGDLEPWTHLYTTFDGLVPELTSDGSSTKTALAKFRRQRLELRDRLAGVANVAAAEALRIRAGAR